VVGCQGVYGNPAFPNIYECFMTEASGNANFVSAQVVPANRAILGF
jgi:hypothetical protein